MDPRQFQENPLNFASSPDDADVRGAQAPTQHLSPPSAGEPNGQQFQQQQEQNDQQQETPEELRARLQEEREARQRAEQAKAQADQQMQEFTQSLVHLRDQQEAQRAQQKYQQDRQKIFDDAQNMSAAEGFRHIQRETERLDMERQQQIWEIQQRAEQRIQSERRALGTPLYADELIKRHGLPQEYRERLLRLGDPDLMARTVPDLVEDHRKYQSLQDQLNQLSRSRQANAFAQSGVGMVSTGGSTGAPGQLSDDPDTRAMQILAALDNGTYQPR